MVTISDALTTALTHHQAGRFQAAEEIYRRILQVQPDQADALHFLGVLSGQIGKPQAAVDYLARAIAVNPNVAPYHLNLGLARQALRKPDEAIACYRRALQLEPEFVEVHYNLGAALAECGQAAEAVACYRRALQLRPGYVEAHYGLGKALQDQGKLDEAIAAYRRALELKPDFAEACNNLGVALKDQGKLDETAACCRRAVELKPDFAEAHSNLGIALAMQEKLDEAVACYRAALQLQPDYAEAHYNLGKVFEEQEKLDEAAACYQRTLQLKPAYPEAHLNLGNVFARQLKLEDAAACFRRALELQPDDANAHLNRAHLWLLQGDFQHGWPEYEWRWQTDQMSPRPFPQPLWDGGPLAGKTILLHAEQGMGDIMQFVRYAALVKRAGGTVIVECPKSLLPLLARCAGIDRLVAQGDQLPPFDTQTPLLSLPRILQTSPTTIPADVPYVFAAPELIASWREKLGNEPGLKIGINWRGASRRGGWRARDIPLRHFGCLAEVPGVRLISLQKGEGSEELAQLCGQFPVVDLGADVDRSGGAFMDTAAIMMNLDLVISSDTAVPHLAGALGVPVWLALNRVPEWRWQLDRPDSPWYPTMRLFRQPARGDWAAVFEQMQRALCQRLESPRGLEKERRPQPSRAENAPVRIAVSAGELIDKITILEIKAAQFTDAGKLRHVRRELELLAAVRDRAMRPSARLSELTGQLKSVNAELWRIEDAIRDCEREKDFGARFIELARSVYRCNDRRFELKRDINHLAGSSLVEEKSYKPYQ